MPCAKRMHAANAAAWGDGVADSELSDFKNGKAAGDTSAEESGDAAAEKDEENLNEIFDGNIRGPGATNVSKDHVTTTRTVMGRLAGINKDLAVSISGLASNGVNAVTHLKDRLVCIYNEFSLSSIGLLLLSDDTRESDSSGSSSESSYSDSDSEVETDSDSSTEEDESGTCFSTILNDRLNTMAYKQCQGYG
ncbi:unnamed protein product [Gongylonema pulchrum]|uniref:Uncharacterized protein n=1 Tax=Gongylonema pulchrum TaxID=637853 RepID=A0A3P6PS37_9BILA|nr:unnamed protein product [Gongylonema pulchrum]